MRLSVKEARDRLEWSQVTAARKLGVSEPTYRKYEQQPEEMRLKTAVALARVLRVKFTDLKLYDEDSTDPR